MSDARVTSTVLPSLCSGVCFKSDSCGTMGFVWFRSSWTVSTSLPTVGALGVPDVHKYRWLFIWVPEIEL